MNLKEEYLRWKKYGSITNVGLCRTLSGTKYRDTLDSLIRPNKMEEIKLSNEGLSTVYWGSGVDASDERRWFTLTPLRENIILLILAIHDEL